MMVIMEPSQKGELLEEIFAIIAEQIGMLFDVADAVRIDLIQLQEAVDLLGLRSDRDKEDFYRLEQRVDRLET
jgi:hypothetical protein